MTDELVCEDDNRGSDAQFIILRSPFSVPMSPLTLPSPTRL